MLKSEALQIIANKISKCSLCSELSHYRESNNYLTVPGEGKANARLFILGEGPGEEEAKTGQPFVGRAGKLLTKIIETAGWRRENVYITNIVKCRPPNNRVPVPDEASNCRNYLDMQIRCVDPEWILCLGKSASIYLLGKSDERSMGSLRGQHFYHDRKVICTYHPSYLLRQPSAKEELWQDIQPIISTLQV